MKKLTLQRNLFWKLTALLCMSLFMILCSRNKGQKPNKNIEAASISMSSNCFKQYEGHLDKLLTKKNILKYYDFGTSNVEAIYEKKYAPRGYQICVYEWESSTRTTTIPQIDLEVPATNRIGVGYLNFYPADEEFPVKTFTATYHLTDAEKKKAQEAIAEVLDEQTKGQNRQHTATTMANKFVQKTKFEPIQDIGDAAVWDYLNSSLKVLKGRAYFDVIVNISDDVEENQTLAKKLADAVLAKCKE